MTEIQIPKDEYGKTRVFAVNRPKSEMARALADAEPSRIIADLLGREVPENGAELVAISDLAGVGLSGYLADGVGVPDDRIAADKAKLDRLDGHVLLVYSSAFEGAATTLKPGPDLTLIATYAEAQPDMTTTPLDSEAAQPYTGVPGPTPPHPPQGRSGGAMIVLALIVIVGLLLWWLL